MKIPAGVGYAIDPLGLLKNKAMDQLKTRARTAIGLDHKDTKNCAAAQGLDLALTLTLPATFTKVAPANEYINMGLIPLETNI